MAEYNNGECHQCGEEYESLVHHWALSSCEKPDGYTSKKEYTCATCGDSFMGYENAREGRGRETFYCSRSCKYEGDKADFITVDCSWCGKDVRVLPCHQESMGDYSLDNHFCDKDCEADWKRREWKGESHPSYKGGSIERVKGSEWHQKRAEVLDRADGSCQMCGQDNESHIEQYGRELAVHHVNPVRSFETARDAHDNNEFLALCVQCHNQAERFAPLRPRIDMLV